MSNDKYADFDSKKSFNRVYNSSSDVLFNQANASSASLMAPERDSSDIDVESQMKGVHEVRLAWRHIKLWVLKNFPEVESTLQSPCTNSDLAEVQKDLSIILPNCVQEFYKLTDGQEFLQGSVGLIYGLRLLPIDQVVVETENWRKVATSLPQKQAPRQRTLLQLGKAQVHQVSETDLTSHSSSSVDLFEPQVSNLFDGSRAGSVSSASSQPVIPTQRSIPPGAICETYAHQMWIPLVTDGVGNCVGIDLAPPANKDAVVGQVILFGREFDTKYKVADNWGDFLLIFANDLENGNWKVKQANEDMNYGDMLFGNVGELVFCDRETKQELNYFEVLKRRAMKQWLSTIDESKQPEKVKTLIQQFRNKKTIVVSLNELSVDDVIRSNLSSIDNINQPLNMKRQRPLVKTTSKTNSDHDKGELKSPLSHEVEYDLAEN